MSKQAITIHCVKYIEETVRLVLKDQKRLPKVMLMLRIK